MGWLSPHTSNRQCGRKEIVLRISCRAREGNGESSLKKSRCYSKRIVQTPFYREISIRGRIEIHDGFINVIQGDLFDLSIRSVLSPHLTYDIFAMAPAYILYFAYFASLSHFAESLMAKSFKTRYFGVKIWRPDDDTTVLK